VPALIPACLYDPDVAVRVRAAVALWRCGRRLHPSLSALIEGVKGSDPVLRWIAAECLGDIGPDAAEAVPALVEAVRHTTLRLVATSLFLALERIDHRTAATVPPP
jgi:HEAT repeat protein